MGLLSSESKGMPSGGQREAPSITAIKANGRRTNAHDWVGERWGNYAGAVSGPRLGINHMVGNESSVLMKRTFRTFPSTSDEVGMVCNPSTDGSRFPLSRVQASQCTVVGCRVSILERTHVLPFPTEVVNQIRYLLTRFVIQRKRPSETRTSPSLRLTVFWSECVTVLSSSLRVVIFRTRSC